MKMSELKWELRKRKDGRLRIYITSVEKPIEQMKGNAQQYRDRFVKHLEAAGEYAGVDVIINSRGGSVASAMGMTSALETISKPGRFLIDGTCGSAATLIPCSLKGEVYITPSSSYFIHRARVVKYHREGGFWKTIGNMQNDAVDRLLRAAYRSRTKKKRKIIRTWMEEGTRFTPQEAVDVGLCNGIMTRAEFDSE